MGWQYFIWEQSCYRNPAGKSKSARRTVLLLHDSLAILKRRHLEQGMPASGWVFSSKSAASGHVVTILEPFNRARDKAGLPKELVLYTARHGFATELAQYLTTEQLMQVLGHSNPRVAMSYQHSETADIQSRLDAVRRGPLDASLTKIVQ